MSSFEAISAGILRKLGIQDSNAKSRQETSIRSFRLKCAESGRSQLNTEQFLMNFTKQNRPNSSAKRVPQSSEKEGDLTSKRPQSAFRLRSQRKPAETDQTSAMWSATRIIQPQKVKFPFKKVLESKPELDVSKIVPFSLRQVPEPSSSRPQPSQLSRQLQPPEQFDANSYKTRIKVKLITNFGELHQLYVAIFDFAQNDVVNKEQYWNKRNVLLYFQNERMIYNDNKSVEFLDKGFGARRVKICEIQAFRFSKNSLLKVKKYLEFFCSTKVAQYKEKFNTFFKDSRTFVQDLFSCLRKPGKESLIMKLETATFNANVSPIMRQVILLKMIRLMTIKEKLIDAIMENYSRDMRVIGQEIEGLLQTPRDLESSDSNDRTRSKPEGPSETTIAAKARVIKEILKKYLKLNEFEQPDVYFALTKKNLSTITQGFAKYLNDRLDYRLYSVKLAYKFYEVYLKSGDNEKGNSLLSKAVLQNFEYLCRYLQFLVKYQHIARYIKQLLYLNSVANKSDRQTSEQLANSEVFRQDPKPATYFEIISEIDDFNIRPKYLRVVFRKLAELLDLDSLGRIMSLVAREAMNLGKFERARTFLIFKKFYFDFVSLYEFYDPLKQLDTVWNETRTDRIKRFLALNTEAFSSNNMLIQVALELEDNSQLVALFATNYFIYRNTLKAMESSDPSQWPTFPKSNDPVFLTSRDTTSKRENNPQTISDFQKIFQNLNENYFLLNSMFTRFVNLIEKKPPFDILVHRKEITRMMTYLETKTQFSAAELTKYLSQFGLQRQLIYQPQTPQPVYFPFHLGIDDPQEYLFFLSQKIGDDIARRPGSDPKVDLFLSHRPLFAPSTYVTVHKYLTPEQIAVYMDITQEEPTVLDLIFRMNLLILENDRKFSNPRNWQSVFNKMAPEPKQSLFNHIKAFSERTQKTHLREKMKELNEDNIRHKGQLFIDIKRRQLTTPSTYTIWNMKRRQFLEGVTHQVESQFIAKENADFRKMVSHNSLIVQVTDLKPSRFVELPYCREDNEFYKHMQTKEKTTMLSSHLKDCYQQQIYFVIKRQLEEEAKKLYVQNCDKVSHCLEYANPRQPTRTISRIRALIDQPSSASMPKIIQKNQKRYRTPKRISRRNIHFLKEQFASKQPIYSYSPEMHFQDVYKCHEEDYVDPIHSIREISRCIFEFSEHQLLKSYFLGLGFEQTRDYVCLHTVFTLNKHLLTRTIVTLRFPLVENLNSRYNHMVQQKSALFYTILPVFHEYLMDRFFREHLFEQTRNQAKGSEFEPIIVDILKKTGCLFSLLFIKLDSRRLLSLAGLELGLYNWMDFCFLKAFVAIAKYLLLITSFQVRKVNGIALRSEYDFDMICSCGFLKENIMGMYVSSIIGQKILDHLMTKSRESYRSPFLQRTTPNDDQAPKNYFAGIRMSGVAIVKELLKIFTDQMHIQQLCLRSQAQNGLIVGTKLIERDNDHILLVYKVEFDLKALENAQKFCQRLVDVSLNKIERRINQNLDKEKFFSLLLTVITKNVFKFGIEVDVLNRKESTDKTGGFRIGSRDRRKDGNRNSQFSDEKRFISCAKMLVFHCFPELINTEITEKDLRWRWQKSMHLLDTVMASFFVKPFEAKSFLPLFQSLLEQISIHQYLYRRESKQGRGRSRFLFDYAIFNQKYDYLSSVLKTMLQDNVCVQQPLTQVQIRNLNIINELDEFIQTKEINRKQDDFFLKYVIPKLKIPEKIVANDCGTPKNNYGFGTPQPRLAILRSSLKSSLTKNQLFMENFMRIKKEVQISMQLFNKPRRNQLVAADFIRKASESSLEDIKLMLDDPFEQQAPSEDQKSQEQLFEIRRADPDKRITFIFYQKSNILIMKNDIIQTPCNPPATTHFVSFEGDPRDWSVQKLVGPMQPRSVIKSFALDLTQKFPLQKLVLSNADCLNFINIVLTRDHFKRAMLFNSYNQKLQEHLRSVIHSAKLKTMPGLFPSDRTLMVQSEQQSQVSKKNVRNVVNSDCLLSRVLTSADWEDVSTNLVKMFIVTQNNMEEIMCQRGQPNIVVIKEQDLINFPGVGHCQTETRYLIHNFNKIIINCEEDFQTLKKALGVHRVLPSLNSCSQIRARILSFLYFRILNFVRIHNENYLMKPKNFSTIFTSSEHIFFRISVNPCDFRFKKYVLILSSADFSMLIREWLIRRFGLGRKASRIGSRESQPSQQHFDALISPTARRPRPPLYQRLMCLNIEQLHRDLKAFILSRLVLVRDSIYQVLGVSTSLAAEGVKRTPHRNEFTLIDSSTLKAKSYYLRKSNSRTLLISHTVFHQDGWYFIVTAWIYKPQKQIKLRVYNPRHKKLSIFWLKNSEFEIFIRQSLNDFLAVFLTEKMTDFLQNHSTKSMTDSANRRVVSCLLGYMNSPSINIPKKEIINELATLPPQHPSPDVTINRFDGVLNNLNRISFSVNSVNVRQFLKKLFHKTFQFKYQLSRVRASYDGPKSNLIHGLHPYLPSGQINRPRPKVSRNYFKKSLQRHIGRFSLKSLEHLRNTAIYDDTVAIKRLNFTVLKMLFGSHFSRLLVSKIQLQSTNSDAQIQIGNKLYPFEPCSISKTVTANGVDFDIDVLFQEGSLRDVDNPFCIRKNTFLQNFNLISRMNAMYFAFEIRMKHPFNRTWVEEQKTVNLKEMMNLYKNDPLINQDGEQVEVVNLYYLNRLAKFVIWKMMQAGSVALSLM
jgi:hypothetical protein